MESQEVEGSLQESWISKRGPVISNTPGPSSSNMSEASGSSSSQNRSGLLPTKRTLSESTIVRQMGPSPVKRQYQASSLQSVEDAQLKELDCLEKKEASLVNQLLLQLQVLHKRCNEERHQIVEEQRRLAERLEHIDANEKVEELAVKETIERQLERVRLDLFQLRQKLPVQGPSSGNNVRSSTLTISTPSTSGGQLDLNSVSDIRRRLGSLDRQRQTLLEQLYAAIGSLNTEGSPLVDVPLHNCAPSRESAGSSTLTERGLPTSQHTEIAESSEQAQSSSEEDSEITSSSDVLAPQDVSFITRDASGNQESSSNQIGEPTEDLAPEDAVQEEAASAEELPNEALDSEIIVEAEKKHKEDTNRDLELALLKLKNIGALVEEELQCSICNELLVAAVTINCAHSFCKHCLGEWKKQRAECPMCRMPITAEHRSVTLDSLISTMVGQLSMDLQQRHKEVVEERAALEAAAAVSAAAASTSGTSSNVRGDSGSSNSSRASRHHGHNYNNNHWQPLPPPHHHHHHHHHHHNSFAHVNHYPPHAHSHAPHAHTHNHAPHAHTHPPHAHVHPPLSQPPYHHALPPLAPPTPRHSTPPPRAPLALAAPGLQGLQGLQGLPGSSQGLPGGAPGSSGGPLGLQGPQSLQGGGPGPQGPHASLATPQGQMQPHDGRARPMMGRRHSGRGTSGSSSASSSEEPSDSTSNYSGSGAFSSTSERTWFDADYGDYEDEDNEGEPPIVPGIPGRYYGGYGVCFYCNQRGHWSNGCPVRFGF